MSPPVEEARYLVSVATYKRPSDLLRLLDTLAVSLDETADVVVVDNDEAASAREVVSVHAVGARYVVETDPGIASARNRGLEFFNTAYHGIIFVDDDEWVEPDWYATLTRYERSTGAGVVQSPVNTVLPQGAPGWIERGGFYQRRNQKTGAELESAATNNTLLTRAAWEAAGTPRFDPAFSSTGGSDWDLFWGVRRAGAKILFCADAVVSETVPGSRLSWSWLKQRFIRNGIVEARVVRKHGEPLAPFILKAAAVLAIGGAQAGRDFVLRRGRQARSMRRVYISLGKFSGLFGYRIHEYSRQ